MKSIVKVAWNIVELMALIPLVLFMFSMMLVEIGVNKVRRLISRKGGV